MEWIEAYEARAMLMAALSTAKAEDMLCEAASAGLLRTHAERIIRRPIASTTGGYSTDNVELPLQFWWDAGGTNLEQCWETNRFSTWFDGLDWTAFFVCFERTGVEQMAARFSKRGTPGLSKGREIEAAMISDRTGAPGQPSSMHLIEIMLRDRFSKGECRSSMRQEAIELERLFQADTKYAGLARPTCRTIENQCGSLFRQLKAGVTE